MCFHCQLCSTDNSWKVVTVDVQMIALLQAHKISKCQFPQEIKLAV